MNILVILVLSAIFVFAVVVVMTRDKDPQQRATVLLRTGAAIMALITALAVIVIVGYTQQNPGEAAAMLISLAWVMPMLILAARPGSGRRTRSLLLALASSFIAACAWLPLDPPPTQLRQRKRTHHGVSVIALAFPAARVGLRRAALAGWLLVAPGVLLFVITGIAKSGPVGSLTAARMAP
ncbi:hypothetical protein [Arthrobacter sp. UYEF20]|uniref:hypothetical protein n=1 Tax=Arthrobacter sp. UYEF20 TaxID=1756363 RepID=UPI003396C273